MSRAAVQMALLEAEVEQAACETLALSDQIDDLRDVVSGRDRLTCRPVRAEGLRRPRHIPYRRNRRVTLAEED